MKGLFSVRQTLGAVITTAPQALARSVRTSDCLGHCLKTQLYCELQSKSQMFSDFDGENAERTENYPWKTMILYWKMVIHFAIRGNRFHTRRLLWVDRWRREAQVCTTLRERFLRNLPLVLACHGHQIMLTGSGEHCQEWGQRWGIREYGWDLMLGLRSNVGAEI